MAELLKGKPVFDSIISALSTKVRELKKRNQVITLGIIRVGEKADDLYYERSIKKTCSRIGIEYRVFKYSIDIEQQALEKAIKAIVQQPALYGILAFFPLPSHLNSERIRNLIPPEKDVDGLTVDMAGKLYVGDPFAFPPCTPAACMALLDYYHIKPRGKHCAIVGRSLTVGKPLSLLLLKENATVTICHSKTHQLSKICQSADILIVAVGRAKMITPEFTHSNQTIIDIGINQDPDKPGHYCGDVDFAKVEPLVRKITPVPNGVGSITTAILCQHTVIAASKGKRV